MPGAAYLTEPLKAHIERYTAVKRTARVVQLEGLFDIPPNERSGQSWDVTLPLHEKPWNIGLIVGPSGCGKSTIARALFGEHYLTEFQWAPDLAVIDNFPRAMPAKDVTMLLSSVGFSSPPSWLRPYGVLSTGEQFRSTMARVLAEMPDLGVIDEFTSVVDRRVAQVGSAAVAKTVRRRGQKLIAVTCHYDVEEWLDPDWIYSPALDQFSWRSLRGRPKINLEIARVHHSAWRLFSRHHYLTAAIHRGATCFCAFIDGEPVAFHSYLPFLGNLPNGQLARRGHRSVTLPDFQGLGIGNALITTGAAMWKAKGFRVFRNTGHPAEIAGAMRSPAWRLTRSPSMSFDAKSILKRSNDRLTASFEYIGEAMAKADARRLLGE